MTRPLCLCTLRSVLALLCLLASCAALGFGPQGHRVTALLAGEHLSPEAAAAVRRILDGQPLAEASIWADQMRGRPDHPSFWGYDHSANWHFVNIPRGRRYESAPRHPRGDAYAALLAFIAVLQGEPLPPGPVREGLALYLGDPDSPAVQPRLRAVALRFLVHLVADLHQPMHVGMEEDRGGNEIAVKWFGEPSNLHRVWDSQLLGALGRNDREWLRRLEASAQGLGATGRREMVMTAPGAWLDEGLALREEVYDVKRFRADFDREYVEAFAPVIERQILKAGLRLAALLNGIFQ